MRWPNSTPPGVQPYNDAVLADLESVLEQVVSFSDQFMTGNARETIEEYRARAFGDTDLSYPTWANDLEDILEPHTTSEFDLEDLTYELLELIGDDAADDNFND